MDPSNHKKSWRRTAVCMVLLICTVLSALLPASAADTENGNVTCFSPADFQGEEETALTGIFVTGVPDEEDATLLLGSRTIVPGDVLSSVQLEKLTLRSNSPVQKDAVLTYLPIYGNTVAREVSLTVALKGAVDQPPQARDGQLETYKNLENAGRFDVTDEEGGSLTYTITRQPRRGTVTVQEDGTFLFTPKKNKVGKDYFTYTATDAAGNVSNEATITIEILKATDDRQYTDITKESSQFEALWMKNTGLFSGVQVANSYCFQPDSQVTRGEFLAMVMKLLDIPVEDAEVSSGFADEDEAQNWLKPYLVSAMRMGLVSGSASEEDGAPVFRPNDPITGAEAAVMLQNILLLGSSETASVSEEVPVWAQDAAGALENAGVTVSAANTPICRMDAAKLLYQVSKLSDTAPGLEVFQEQ